MNKDKPYLNTDRKNIAEKWNAKMSDEYESDIMRSISMSHWDDNGSIEEIPEVCVDFVVGDTGCGIAAAACTCGVLNFASFTSPGGGFMKGAIAQEEFLCHNSTLYNVLSDKRFADGYAKHKKKRNNGLYANWSIWTPNIVYFLPNGQKQHINVLTCAAPNKKEYLKVCPDNTHIYDDTLLRRIEYVLDQFYKRGDRTIVLGAFGCGVFGNDPIDVADCFRHVINKKHYNSFDRIIFAIPEGKNLTAFKNVFGCN